ncbi:MAG: metallophosphoesterase [Lachnospiraceae bacterium]|nr:metallophosphoesterase [Lachnospiraceae bacterium]
MNLEIKFMDNYSADGEYTIWADGYDTAELYWADCNGVLPEWTAFGYVKIDAGLGRLDYYGGRRVPFEATHVFVRAFRANAPDCMEKPFVMERLFPIEREHRTEYSQTILRCSILTDLHLTRKAGTLKWALRAAADTDCILLPGDMTNDGTKEEFRLFEDCLNETAPGVPLYCVNGNHDLMTDADEYEEFQKRIARWNSETQNICHATFKGIDMIGVNAGALWTRDIMRITPEQLVCIDSLLGQGNDWKIVLCHTPLSRDMPIRNGHLSKYLSRDKQLQEIVDKHEHVIFLSGHTHLSPNLDSGVVSFDSARSNLYVNCGSIRPTELGKEAAPALPEWKEGNVVELRIMEKALEVRMRTIHTRKCISRGF